MGIIRGKVVFIGDYSMKPRLINVLKAKAKLRPQRNDDHSKHTNLTNINYCPKKDAFIKKEINSNYIF